MTKWRETEYVDWGDGGPAEFMTKDGKILRGRIVLDEFWGGDEVPVPEVTLDDGTKADFFGFDKWRPVADPRSRRETSP